MTMRPTADDYITTWTGVKFNFREPTPDQINLDDVAHSLSMQCRYNGHCSEFYSVAEHSVLIAGWVYSTKRSKRLALEALLHDASEAYLCDIPRPIKPHLDPNYHDLEHAIERAVARKWNLTLPWNDFVKEGDSRICLDEHAALFEERLGPCDWKLPYSEPLGIRIQCWMPNVAEREFRKLFFHLTGV